MKKYAGGCQCGSIRFLISGPLGSADICHCRMCQKAFGSWGAALVRISLEDFSWTRGTPSKFKSSKTVDRGFCQNCGTPLYMFEDSDTFIDLAIGTLDDPNIIKLSSQMGIESKLQWFDTMHKLPDETTSQNRSNESQPVFVSLQHPDHDTQ
jgi:hypothetical protein